MNLKTTVKKTLSMICFALALTLFAGTNAKAEGLQDENIERLDKVYVMDEDGNIFEVEDEAGIVEGNETATYSMKRATTVKVVNFNTKGNAVTEYKEYGTNAAGYTNGAFGADAAYIGEEDDKVIFMLSGVVGKVSKGEVQLVDFSNAKSISYYIAEDGKLKHRITGDMSKTTYSTLIYGSAPAYLKAGVKYYSYDGHYFYEDYALMLADYQGKHRDNSVNPDAPYYNYFQFLPLRSQTSYSAGEVNALLDAKVSSTSKMKNMGNAFIEYQDTYGVNGLIITSIAANESSWGTSNICMKKNNLFGINAVDESPGTSATTFASAKECIRQFAETYMSKRYLRPGYTYYHGGFLGNKASGINVSYASDPYWGEKAANIAYSLEQNGGNKDYGKYTIGIKDSIATNHTSVNVRNGSSTSATKLYQTGKESSYAVIVRSTKPENDFYMIQSDGVLNANRSAVVSTSGEYDFENMYAYISAQYVTIVHRGNAEEEPEVDEPEVDEPEVNIPAVDLSFSGASLTLQDNLAINFKVKESLFTETGYENPYVVFSLNGSEVTVKEYKVEDNYVVFAFTDIAPHQMNDLISATLYAQYDGKEYESTVRTYSVAMYCYNMLAKSTGDSMAEFRTLLVDLLNYGAESQIYTGHHTNNLVNALLTEEHRAWGTTTDREYVSVQDAAYVKIDNPAVSWKGAGLNLKDRVEIRVKLAADNIDNLRIKVTSDTTSHWIIPAEKFEKTSGGYNVYFNGLNAGQMSKVVYLTVYNGDTPISNTVRYSIESYVANMQNNADTKLVSLLNAMMKYGDSAYNYAY